MIRVTALYRNFEDARFDFEYYLNPHMNLTMRLLTPFGLLSYEVHKCTRTLDGLNPEFICITHVDFSSRRDLNRGLAAHGKELEADVSNYTNVEPGIEISEIVGPGP